MKQQKNKNNIIMLENPRKDILTYAFNNPLCIIEFKWDNVDWREVDGLDTLKAMIKYPEIYDIRIIWKKCEHSII